jgi:hypothetical protein
MAFDLAKVQEVAIRPGSSQPEVVRENHYIRLNGEGSDAPLFIQGGQVWGAGGDHVPMDELPPWFFEEVAKCTPQALAVVGWPIEGQRRRG